MPALQQAIDQFRAVEPKEALAAWSAGKSLAEALADLGAALDRGRDELEKARRRLVEEPGQALAAALNALYTPRNWPRRRLVRSYHDRPLALVRDQGLEVRRSLFAALLEGYDLIQSRLRRALNSEQIEWIISGTPPESRRPCLRTLKQRAEQAPGESVREAVITVPALFTEGQRRVTRDDGELAGLDVVRIIGEPTAAVLTCDPHPPERERLLVYDRGGGTFDVSIVQVEGGAVEALTGHGDTKLAGDDFDQRLLDWVCDQFQKTRDLCLRESGIGKSRVLRVVDDAKKVL